MTSRIASLLMGCKLSLAAALCLTALALPTAAHAQSLFSASSVSVFVQPTPTFVSGNEGTVSTTGTEAVGLGRTEQYSDGFSFTSATARSGAQSNYGYNFVSWEVSASGGGSGSAQTFASSRYSDSLTFDKSGLTGMSGFVTYSINVAPGNFVSPNTSIYRITHGGQNAFGSSSFGTGSHTSVLMPVILGTPINIESFLSTETRTANTTGLSSSSGGAVVNLTSITLYNSAGQPISGGTVRGASLSGNYTLTNGTTLTTAVPEGGTLTLLLPALGMVGIVVVRRKAA